MPPDPQSQRPSCPPPSLQAVPSELKNRRQWVGWQFEQKGERWTKVPVDPRTGGRASSTDPATWGSVHDAEAARTRFGLDGIGFVFSQDDPFCGIDLDGCIDGGGAVVEPAKQILDALNSYSEVSPSGRGVKVFIKARKPANARCKSIAIAGFKEAEVYDRDRFFTVTGQQVASTPGAVEDRQDGLEQLCARLWPPPELDSPRRAVRCHGADAHDDDDALLARMFSAVNGAAIKSLFHGDTSAHDRDDSRADLALCNHLAFWTGNDATRVDRLFRRSGLFRPKWDENRGGQTYGQRTIDKAINGSASLIGWQDVRQRSQASCRFPMTDLGNVERLHHRVRDELRYCHFSGRWMVWDKRRWIPDQEGRAVRRAGETARSIGQDAARERDPATSKSLYKWQSYSESRRGIEAMVALARCHSDLVVQMIDLDRDVMQLNVLNGTIDLRTGDLAPHRRDDLITKLAPVPYDPQASCPRFEAFLQRIFEGDSQLIGFMQRLLGYCLTGDASEQILPICHGPGANGKSVLLDTMLAIMGDYACLAPPYLLTQSSTREHPTEIADLQGRRLVVASETEDGAVLKLQFVKRLTGDAVLKGRFMRQDYFSFPRTHKIIMATNNRPQVREQSEAAWRRLRLIPFAVVIPPGERDPRLIDKLRDEAPGILNWLVQGCLMWSFERLEPPSTVLAATREYRDAEDSLGRFIADRLVAAEPGSAQFSAMFIPWSVLVKQYSDWCIHTGEAALSPRALGVALERRGHYSNTRRFGDSPTKGRMGLGLPARPQHGDSQVQGSGVTV